MGGGLGDEMGDMSDGDIRERFGRIEGRLGSLELRADGADDWIEESRRFHQRMGSYVDTVTARDAERDRIQSERHLENQAQLGKIASEMAIKTKSWTVAGVCVTIAGVLVSILAIFVMVKLAKVSDVRDIWHSSNAPVMSQLHATQ